MLALFGQIPSRSSARATGCCTRSRTRSASCRTLTKWAARIEKPQDAPALVARAFKSMASGRPRPVGLEVPPDMLQARADIELGGAAAAAGQALDEDAIGRAAKLLENAERPLIFVGGGALDAADEVRALAERLSAPVVAYRRGKGVMDERHPLAQVLTGGHALWAGRRGARGRHAAAMPPGSGAPTTSSRSSRSISTGRDRAHRQAGDRPRRRRRGRAGAAQRASAPSAARASGPRRREPRLKERTAQKLAGSRTATRVLRAIRDVLPDNGVLVEELTQVAYASRVLYEARHPRSFITSGYQGTLGWGVATALGVKHALGDMPVVSINGDGGFMFTVQELATAVRHRIPLVIVVFNDAAYGNVRKMQKTARQSRDRQRPRQSRLRAARPRASASSAAAAPGPRALRRALEKSARRGTSRR